MWIIPKTLHISAYVPDMEALTSDFQELSQQCAQSLFVKSKLMHVRTWLRKWKQDSWIQPLYGRILKPSHGQVFLEKWTSSLEDSLVNRLAPQEIVEPTKTRDISSPIFFEDSENWGYQQLFFSRMSKELLAPSLLELNGPILQEHLFCNMCLENWNAWVTEQRQEYSARLKLAPHINASEYSYLVYEMTYPQKVMHLFPVSLEIKESQNWPTPTTQETPHPQATLTETGRRVSANGTSSHSLNLHDTVILQEMHGQLDEVTFTMDGSRLESQINLCLPNINVQTQSLYVPKQLNLRWVETLMGIPIGWTMATCAAPWTVMMMNYDSSEMESFLQSQNELSESCGKDF